MREKFYDLVDEVIELGAWGVGRPVWNQMKDDAARDIRRSIERPVKSVPVELRGKTCSTPCSKSP